MKKFIVWQIGPSLLLGALGLLLLIGLIGGGNQQTLRSETASGGNICSPSGDYDKDKIDEVLERAGAFKGKRAAFEHASAKHNFDPVLMIAISIHETAWGTSRALLEHNNPSGQMRGNQIIHFDSLEDGLEMTGQTLYNLWNESGLNTIEKLGSAYAPVGAGNDPTNLNIHWVPTIHKFIEELGGLSGGCEGESVEGDLITGADGFVVPMKNFTITSHYGPRWGAFHRGIDLAAPEGEPIYAAKDGIVTRSEYHFSWGNYVTITHEGGATTLYAHNQRNVATVGQKVKQGELIAYMGNTGHSTGPHLHLELCLDNSLAQDRLVDPYPVFFGNK
ncbi:peptidoglycan DD-metalloendopeptidase family protein [Enterococcus innesii]|uniref:peptidoglycan DD-metalloendopeptidase family protein n=1 Tax=Enterococcus innesii TaxID=2839759 RepID=UPI002DBEB587|nr:peptidoglycan DD-metalloendopeptidase family protein [Enterococcus innesii]MEB5953126.1 peptidoglycan DD-metalloendopeptidase family protein [Enterococcus innesii]